MRAVTCGAVLQHGRQESKIGRHPVVVCVLIVVYRSRRQHVNVAVRLSRAQCRAQCRVRTETEVVREASSLEHATRGSCGGSKT
eukprot:SAG31_NODE_731_length_12498_cov_7.368336_11_plen_84_part_00